MAKHPNDSKTRVDHAIEICRVSRNGEKRIGRIQLGKTSNENHQYLLIIFLNRMGIYSQGERYDSERTAFPGQ